MISLLDIFSIISRLWRGKGRNVKEIYIEDVGSFCNGDIYCVKVGVAPERDVVKNIKVYKNGDAITTGFGGVKTKYYKFAILKVVYCEENQ